MHKHKLIIDTDPGIDDAMAIHYAFAHPEIETLGLTTIFGNVFVQQATRNALILCQQAHQDIPVSQGETKPLTITPNPPAHFVHGEEGFGDLPALTPKTDPDSRPAHQFLADTIRAHSGEIILCPIGPLTNIGRLLQHNPDIVKHVKKLVIMGGAVKCQGNVTPHAEANIWNDPHAADLVFAADWPIELIGLDITQSIACSREDFAALAKAAPEIGGFLDRISGFYIDFYHKETGRPVCLMHDPTAIIAITDPDTIGFEEIPLRVICEGEAVGALRRDESGTRKPVRVAMTADAEMIRKKFLDICGLSDTMRQRGK